MKKDSIRAIKQNIYKQTTCNLYGQFILKNASAEILDLNEYEMPMYSKDFKKKMASQI
jgi:hypothetical protein